MTTITRRTELAHRTNDGLHVYLFWNEPTSRVTVRVHDARGDDSCEFEVDGRHALDAFNHPYALRRPDRHDRPRCLDRRSRHLTRLGQRLAGNDHQPMEDRPCTHGSITRHSPFPAP
jgi:hypothetical protein